jgi:hypothetical protein
MLSGSIGGSINYPPLSPGKLIVKRLYTITMRTPGRELTLTLTFQQGFVKGAGYVEANTGIG